MGGAGEGRLHRHTCITPHSTPLPGPVSDALEMEESLTFETRVSVALVCTQGLLGGFSQTEGPGTPAVTAICVTARRSKEWLPASQSSICREFSLLYHLVCLLESFLKIQSCQYSKAQLEKGVSPCSDPTRCSGPGRFPGHWEETKQSREGTGSFQRSWRQPGCP